MNVPPQDVITRDNVSVKIAAVVYFRVVDPNSALTQVEKYLFAISQMAQTTLRSVCGQAELDQILSQRERINALIQGIVDAQTAPWGIKISLVAVKDIDLPPDMQRAMRNRRRQNGRGGPKSFMRRASFKPHRNYPMRRRFSPNSPPLFTSVSYKRSPRLPSKKIIRLSFHSPWTY